MKKAKDKKCLDKGEWKKFYSADGIMDREDYRMHAARFKPYFDAISKYAGTENALILEVACGPAKLLTILSKMGNYRIIASDINEELLKIAKINVENFGGKNNVEFHKMDCFNLSGDPWLKGKKFDAIVHHGFIEHFKDMRQVVKLLNIQAKACRHVIFGLPYYTKRNIELWNRSGYRVCRNKWLYRRWKNFLAKNFNVVEMFRFCGKSDNLVCVISGAGRTGNMRPDGRTGPS